MAGFTELDNILLNMSAGLAPESLTKSEIKILENRYGPNWFTELGYTEDEFNRNKFDNYNNQ